MGVACRIGLAKKGSQLIDADNTFSTNFARSSHIPGDEGVSGCDPYSGLLSGFGACTPRHKVVPAGQIGELRSYFNVCQRAADVDCDQRRNISDCVAVAGNELITLSSRSIRSRRRQTAARCSSPYSGNCLKRPRKIGLVFWAVRAMGANNSNSIRRFHLSTSACSRRLRPKRFGSG
jgi:hypothetical protein